MAKKIRRAHWSYCVEGHQLLRCYTNKFLAIRVAKAKAKLAKHSWAQVFVEKVRTNTAGVHNPYAKGAKVIWVSDFTRR